MSDSLQPHGLQPARLLCPWRFSRQEYQRALPCHSPRDLPDSGIKSRSVKSPALADGFFTTSATWEIPKCQSLSRVQLFAMTWTVACQTPLSMEFPKQEYWNGLPCPFPGDLPDPGFKPRSPALQADSLPSEPPRKPISHIIH